ncbi:MAG: PAS domain-containing sensor histidine kinase [Gaiellaceae bacterium]
MTAAQTELERFFDLSIDMMCVLGYDGFYKRVNAAFQRTLGFTQEELLAQPFLAFVHPDDRQASVADLEQLGSGIQTGIYEERHLHKDGSYRWLQWTAVSGGDELSCYALARDVTDRRLADAELASSRARIVEATDATRRRIERDLHDGAQQRLVSLSIALRLAETRIHADPDTAMQILASAREELAQSLSELRELARGIHPAILDHGLTPALESLVARASLPVSLAVELDERVPDAIERALYFVASEALANIAKHAQASNASIRVTGGERVVRIAIEDDGVGGADSADGSGLRGLADRVEALGGRLEVVSPRGGGTALRAELPCVSGA